MSNSDGVPALTAVLVALVVAVAAFVVYWQTAYPTITWWGSSSYTLAATTLGIHAPPGSLLLTILGWLVTLIPWGRSPAYILNLFAAVLGAVTVGMVFLAILRTIRASGVAGRIEWDRTMQVTSLLGAVAGAFLLAFGYTLWSYSIQFTPYVLSALFTALILGAMLKWWQEPRKDSSFKWLFLIALLFGLDFSVHRTNLLLLPGLLVWVILRFPRTLIRWKSWVYGVIGFLIGLAVHILVIPLAALGPYYNHGDPSTLSRFWDYVSLKQYGGGWLLNLWPRSGDFWSDQVWDYLQDLAGNFFWIRDLNTTAGGFIFLIGLLGLLLLWVGNWRLATGLSVLYLLASLGAILYFNTSPDFFRSMDRHYLPSFVLFSMFIGVGLTSLPVPLRLMQGFARLIATAILVLAFVALVWQQYQHNLNRVDGSDRYFCYDAGQNYFATLPEYSILFTSGDNDTYPLWYLQRTEKVRPDVGVCNVNLMNTDWYMPQVLSRDPGFPLTMPEDSLRRVHMITWQDTVLRFPVSSAPEDYAESDSSFLPDTLAIRVPPDVDGKYLLPQDQLLIRIIRENQWRRPLYFTYPPEWLEPYCRPEGLAYRLLPMESPPLNREILKRNLYQRYEFRGYNDESIPLTQPENWQALSHYSMFLALARSEGESAGRVACLQVIETMNRILPADRVEPPEQIRSMMDLACSAPDSTE